MSTGLSSSISEDDSDSRFRLGEKMFKSSMGISSVKSINSGGYGSLCGVNSCLIFLISSEGTFVEGGRTPTTVPDDEANDDDGERHDPSTVDDDDESEGDRLTVEDNDDGEGDCPRGTSDDVVDGPPEEADDWPPVADDFGRFLLPIPIPDPISDNFQFITKIFFAEKNFYTCCYQRKYLGNRYVWHNNHNNYDTIDKWNQQLKFEIWDVNKRTERDSKVLGSNLDPSNLFTD